MRTVYIRLVVIGLHRDHTYDMQQASDANGARIAKTSSEKRDKQSLAYGVKSCTRRGGIEVTGQLAVHSRTRHQPSLIGKQASNKEMFTYCIRPTRHMDCLVCILRISNPASLTKNSVLPSRAFVANETESRLMAYNTRAKLSASLAGKRNDSIPGCLSEQQYCSLASRTAFSPE